MKRLFLALLTMVLLFTGCGSDGGQKDQGSSQTQQVSQGQVQALVDKEIYVAVTTDMDPFKDVVEISSTKVIYYCAFIEDNEPYVNLESGVVEIPNDVMQQRAKKYFGIDEFDGTMNSLYYEDGDCFQIILTGTGYGMEVKLKDYKMDGDNLVINTEVRENVNLDPEEEGTLLYTATFTMAPNGDGSYHFVSMTREKA